MIKWLHVAMDKELKDKLDSLRKQHGGWVKLFEHLTKDVDLSKQPIKPVKKKEEKTTNKKEASFESAKDLKELKPKSREGVPKEELLKNWQEYAEGQWNETMVKVVDDLKFSKKEEFPQKINDWTAKFREHGFSEEQIKQVVDKAKELKQLFIENKQTG